MDLDHPDFIASMVAIGHMTLLCSNEFAASVRTIVTKTLVKELLMHDKV